LLALHLTPGLGPIRIAALIEHFGSAAAARAATASALQNVPGIGSQLSSQLAQQLPNVDIDTEIARAARAGARILALGTPDYPPHLATIPAAPPILYALGGLTAGDERGVSLVGTRNPNAYGKRVAKQLAEGLARAGVTVVSGMARGVDGIAHRAALDAGGRTVAVLGSGLSRLYPPEHAALAEAIAKSGAVVSECFMEEGPSKGSFPARNRIIVIVQAPRESGALITATHAAEQGKTVLAVPGPIDDDAQAGCLHLLRQGAVLCRGVDDILEELDGVSAQAVASVQRNLFDAPEPACVAGPPPGMDAVQMRVWDFLEGGARSVDEVARHVAIAIPALSGVLMMMEMNRAVRRLPGNRYERA
jgi:DNA processing protein